MKTVGNQLYINRTNPYVCQHFSSSTPLPRSRTLSQAELIIHPTLHTAYSISEFVIYFITQISTVLLICTSSLINDTVCFEPCESRFLVMIAIHNAVSNASRDSQTVAMLHVLF